MAVLKRVTKVWKKNKPPNFLRFDLHIRHWYPIKKVYVTHTTTTARLYFLQAIAK